MAVAVEVARSDRFQARAGFVAARPAAGQSVPVHVPDRGLTACILQQDVGLRVAIEVVCSWIGRPSDSAVAVGRETTLDSAGIGESISKGHRTAGYPHGPEVVERD